MAVKVDVIVAGQGIGVHAAALAAAKSGLSVGWLPPQSPVNAVDSTGLFLSSAIEQISKDFAAHAPGLAKVVPHRLYLLGDGAGTSVDFRSDARTKHPETYLAERSVFEGWLAGVAEIAGVKKFAGGRIAELMTGDHGQVQAIRTSNDEVIRCHVVIMGQGAEHPLRDVLEDAMGPEERVVATAVARLVMDPTTLSNRLGIEAGEGVFGRVLGNLADGLPASGWIAASGGTIQIGLSTVFGPHAENPSDQAKSALNGILASAALKPLLRGAGSPSFAAALRPICGHKYIAPMFGSGWLLVGPSTRLGDPLRHETSHIEVTCGALAANAAQRAISAGDTSARALSVYRAMVEDSFIMKDLKAQRNAVEDIERDPTVLSYYPQFVNRMFAHDTEAALAPRRERNREFFRNLRNERPVWEFAMGLRKSLKLMRD